MADTNDRPKSKRGFAAMDSEQQRQIARKGGESVPPEARAFSRDHALAAEAGRKGGEHSHGGGRKQQTPSTEATSSDTPTTSENE